MGHFVFAVECHPYIGFTQSSLIGYYFFIIKIKMIINYKSNDINAKTIRKKVLNFISIPPSFTKIKKATTNNQSSHGNYYNKIKPLN